MRGSKDEDMPGELDYSNGPSPNYTVEELVKMVNVKNSGLEEGDEAAYKEFIRQILRYPGTPPR